MSREPKPELEPPPDRPVGDADGENAVRSDESGSLLESEADGGFESDGDGASVPQRRADHRVATTLPGVLAPALAAVICVVATWATWTIFVSTTRGQLLEEAARLGAESLGERLSPFAQVALGPVNAPVVALVVIVTAAVALLQRRWHIAIAGVVVLCGANLTTQVLQQVLERPVLDTSPIVVNSFPSGHATIAASVAATALLVVPVSWRPGTALVGTVLSTAVGIATMVGDNLVPWHRGSDVIAALLVTAAWYFLAEAVLAAMAPRSGRSRAGSNASPRRNRIPLRILTVIGSICAGLGGGGLIAGMILSPLTSDLGKLMAFVCSAAGVAAVECFTIAALLRLRPHFRAENEGAATAV